MANARPRKTFTSPVLKTKTSNGRERETGWTLGGFEKKKISHAGLARGKSMNNKTTKRRFSSLSSFFPFSRYLARLEIRLENRFTVLIEIEIELEQITRIEPIISNSINQRKLGCRVN